MEGWKRHYRFRLPQKGFLPPSREEIALEKNLRYEEAVVKHILRRCGLSDMGRELWKHRKELDDFGRLAFSDFQEATGFPIWLRMRRISTPRQSSLVDMLCNFHRTPIYEAFLEVRYGVPDCLMGRPVGLVFPVPGIKYMAMHTWGCDQRPGATRISVPLGDSKSPLIVERFDNLLEALGPPEGWGNLFC